MFSPKVQAVITIGGSAMLSFVINSQYNKQISNRNDRYYYIRSRNDMVRVGVQ